MSLPLGYYVLLVHFLKVKELLNNPGIYPACPRNCNSLGAGILDKASRNKEIIKVDIVTRSLRRLGQSLNQVQDYCLCLISTVSSPNCAP